MSRRTLLLLVCMLSPAVTQADAFRPGAWSKGLHLTAAAGVAESVFFESQSPREHLP